jgi:RHS repeat-associated protein
MTGDGLPDILKTTENSVLLWQNIGKGTLIGPTALKEIPSTLNLSKPNVAFADLNGNGRVDLFATDQPFQVAFENNGKGGFDSAPIVFYDQPNIRLSGADTRLTDLNGDGITDLLSSGLTHFLLYNQLPGKGWQEPFAVKRINDIDTFPDLDLSEPGVKLADLTGDGLQDFVYVKSGNISYWPYSGNGKWGRRIEMQNAPIFPPGYRESNLHVVDIDGDGCSDVVYFDYDKTIIWINQSGIRFSSPIEIPIAPVKASSILAADFMGDGKLGFIWSCTRTQENSAGYRFLRFDEGRKPYLLTTINNGMGGKYEMEYTSHLHQEKEAEDSSEFGKLPFPVQVVKTIREKDAVTLRCTEYSMKYYKGIYDGVLKEFRGFSTVFVNSKADEGSPETRQQVEFFQGDPEAIDLIERNRQRALSGSTTRVIISELVKGFFVKRKESVQKWETRLEFDNGQQQVYFPFISEINTIDSSEDADPDKIEITKFSQPDVFGNIEKKTRESFAEGSDAADHIKIEELYVFSSDLPNYLVKLPVRSELRDNQGQIFGVKINFYDGADFIGLPEGQVSKGMLTRTQELKLLESKIPAGYVQGRDFSALGYVLTGAGDLKGYYVNSFSVKRDSTGNIISQKDPIGISLTIVYDSDNLFPVKTIDVRGRETIFTFNPRSGEPLTTTFPDGRKLRQQFDPLGRLVANYETDKTGNEQLLKCWITDLSKSPVSIISVAASKPGFTFEELTGSFDTLEDVSLSKVFYDGFGTQIQQITSVASKEAESKKFVVNGQAKINSKGLACVKFASAFVENMDFLDLPVTDAGCVRQRYDYNGNVIETQGPIPVHFRIVRDTFTIKHYEGDQAGVFGVETPTGNPSRTEYFDAHSRLVRIEEFKGDGSAATTSYELTLDGKIKTIKQDLEIVTRFTFAGPGEAIKIKHRDIGERTYYYDAMGNIIERLNPDGSALFYTYDDLKRLVKIEFKKTSASMKTIVREIFFDVDPVVNSAGRFLEGRIALLKEGTNEFRYSYNPSGKPVKEEITASGVTLVTQREFDLQGRASAVVYPDGHRVEYELDPSGVVTGINGYVSDINYASDGNTEGYTLANGVQVSMPRDPLSRRLNAISATKDGVDLRKLAYGYDRIGNIIQIVDEMPGNIEFNTFGYDSLHRLSEFTKKKDNDAGAVLKSGNYTYDATGNILDFEDVNPLTLKYNDAVFKGRATAIVNGSEEIGVSYNNNGHINSMGELSSLEFDAMDRLTKVVKKDLTEIHLAYDAQGRRILKEVVKNGVTTTVRYAGGLYEQHQTHVIRNIFFGTFLIASEKIAVPENTVAKVFYVNDHHGTALMMTDASGVIIHNQRYSPFGAALDNAQVLDRYLGKDKDEETGLIQMGARYYAPLLGRFISPDWYVLDNPNKPMRMPQGYNVYGYALNNPLIFKDPSGLWFGIDDLIVAAVGFVVGFVGGLIYGLANGQGWGSFLTALETGLTTAAGAWLGWNTTGVFGLVNGGFNGFMGGIHGIYDWSSADGWFAFISDSTWGIVGTSMGNVVQVINLFGSTGYRDDLSRRQNRTVYEGGAYVKEGFAFTMGNVISNAGQNGRGINASFIANHEELHVWQNRFFGPLFQGTYVVWAVGGFIAGSIYWFFNTNENYGSVIETTVYYDNPFEYWAYKNDSNWPPSGANHNLTF